MILYDAVINTKFIMTDKTISTILKVNPDATIKDLFEFLCLNDDQMGFEIKRAEIRRRAEELENKLPENP